MLSITCRVNDVVEIGKFAAVRVAEKTGQAVRLQFVADPDVHIRLNPSGVFPKRFAVGTLNEDPRRMVDDINNGRPMQVAAF